MHEICCIYDATQLPEDNAISYAKVWSIEPACDGTDLHQPKDGICG